MSDRVECSWAVWCVSCWDASGFVTQPHQCDLLDECVCLDHMETTDE